MRRVCLLAGVVVVVVVGLACPPPPAPPTVEEALDGGLEDAGGDAGLFEIGHRDAGPLYESALPWKWASVEQVIQTPPASGPVAARWVPVLPTAVDRAWAGGVLLFDGGVVAVPFNSTAVLMIHPDDDTSERWPVLGGGVEEGWQGGVLLPDGKVIAFPRNANRFLRIDPATRTAEPFGDDLTGSGADGGIDKFRGGVLGLNGQVYAAPSEANFIARLDPNTGHITRIPIPPTIRRGGTQGAVVFPTGDIVMFPSFDGPGLLVIPSRNGGADEVWLIRHPATPGAAAFNAGGVLTSIERAVSPPHQNAMPLQYEAGVLSYMEPLQGVSERSANAWFFGAWSTNGHYYSPPFGQTELISFSVDRPAALVPFDPGLSVFRAVLGVVALPDGRIIGIPHARSAWLELMPPRRLTVPSEAFTSPYLNKL